MAHGGRRQEPDRGSPSRARRDREYLRDLPRLWSEASPEARQLIAASLFEETSALGWKQFRYTWTQHAIRRGLREVIRAS